MCHFLVFVHLLFCHFLQSRKFSLWFNGLGFSDESPSFTFLWIQQISYFTHFLLPQTSFNQLSFLMKVQLWDFTWLRNISLNSPYLQHQFNQLGFLMKVQLLDFTWLCNISLNSPYLQCLFNQLSFPFDHVFSSSYFDICILNSFHPLIR